MSGSQHTDEYWLSAMPCHMNQQMQPATYCSISTCRAASAMIVNIIWATSSGDVRSVGSSIYSVISQTQVRVWQAPR